jgi:hypothetical protein
MMGVRAALALALAATMPVAAACSNDVDERNAYVAAVNRAQTDFRTTFEHLGAQITATSSPQQDRRTLRGFSDAVDRAVTRLRRVDPPPEVRTLHGRLIASIDDYGRQIDKARTAFRSTSTARIIEAQTALISGITAVSRRINRTIGDINRALKE